MKPGIDYTGVSVSFYCHDGRGNFLMQQRGPKARDEHGAWEFGAGGVEFGEEPAEAVLREVFEEYSARGVISEALSPLSLVRESTLGRMHWIVFPFVIQISPQDVTIAEPGFALAQGWFVLDRLPSPLHPGAVQLFAQHKNSLTKYS